MPIDSINSFFDIPAIQAEFAAIRSGLSESQSNLVGLYNVIKGFKDTSISTLAANTDQLSTAINGSVQATTKAKSSYDDLTQKITAQVKAVNESSTSINENSEAYDQLIKQAVKNKIANDDLVKSTAALKKSYDSGTSSLEEYSNTLASIKDAQQSLKIANQGITQSLNNMERQSQAANGSLNQLRATLNGLTANFDALDEVERNSQGGQKLLSTIKEVHDKVMELEFDTGRPGRNVGNYFNSLKPAIDILKEELVGVNAELAQMEKAKASGVQNLNPIGFKTASQQQQEGLSGRAGTGPTNLAGGMGFDPNRYKELTEQAQALNVVIEQTGKSFTSITMATRASERALQTMAAAGLEGTEGFEKLRESTIEAAQAQKEFLRQEKLLESEAPVLGAITLAAKGLAGAYAVGAGSVALFAEGNEKVEKELNKLVAIMTILQGLNEAYELINKSGAGAQAIKMALTKATNSLIGEQVVKTQAAAVADTELAAAETEVAVTSEAQAAATTELAAATDGVVVAEEAATAATITFGRALVMTGIGAAIAAVAVAIGYLISKIPDWIQGDKLTIKEQENLADAMKKTNDIIVAQTQMIIDLDSSDKRSYEQQLALSSAAGENAYKQFAIKKQIAAEEKRLAKEQMDLLGAGAGSESQLRATIKNNMANQKEALRIQAEMIAAHRNLSPLLTDVGKAESKEQEETAAKNVEFYQKQIDRDQAAYAALKKAREEYYAAIQKGGQLEYEQEKFTADEQRKLALETGNLQVEAAKDRNSKILSDARSTSAQRLAAIKSDRDQEMKAAQLQRNSLDPNATPAEEKEANDKLHAAQAQANRDFAQKTRQEKRKEYEKDRDARLEIFRQANAESQAAEEDVLGRKIGHEERDTTGDKKLQALSAQYQEQKNLSDQNRREDLDAEGLNQKQKLAINKKYDVELEDLQLKYLHNLQSIQKEILAATLSDLEQYYQDRETEINKNSNKELAALEKRLAAGKISEEKYRELRRREEEAHAQDLIDNQVLKNYSVLQSTKSGTKEQSDAQAKLTKDLGTQQDTRSGNAQADKDQRLKHIQEEAEKISEITRNAGESVETLVSIGYNKQVMDLENLEKRQARAYTVEQKQIEDSSASQEQKALRMKILDEQKTAEDTKNARKQRQLDIEKAKFDKTKRIFDIITGTAVAVVESLPNLPLAVSVGILGAVQLAAAIAQPLPKYKQGAGVAGRPVHKGGLGVVGDAFVPELIAEPGKTPFWSPAVPSVLDMAPGTKIYPTDEINRMINSGMFVNQFGIIHQKETNRDLLEVKQAIIWQTGRIERALAKNKPKVVNNIKLDAKFGEHIYKSVFK